MEEVESGEREFTLTAASLVLQAPTHKCSFFSFPHVIGEVKDEQLWVRTVLDSRELACNEALKTLMILMHLIVSGMVRRVANVISVLDCVSLGSGSSFSSVPLEFPWFYHFEHAHCCSAYIDRDPSPARLVDHGHGLGLGLAHACGHGCPPDCVLLSYP